MGLSQIDTMLTAQRLARAVEDSKSVTRTWLVEPGQALQIVMLADELGVNHSALVRYLLRFALDAVASGDLPLDTEPCKWRLIESHGRQGRGARNL